MKTQEELRTECRDLLLRILAMLPVAFEFEQAVSGGRALKLALTELGATDADFEVNAKRTVQNIERAFASKSP